MGRYMLNFLKRLFVKPPPPLMPALSEWKHGLCPEPRRWSCPACAYRAGGHGEFTGMT